MPIDVPRRATPLLWQEVRATVAAGVRRANHTRFEAEHAIEERRPVGHVRRRAVEFCLRNEG